MTALVVRHYHVIFALKWCAKELKMFFLEHSRLPSVIATFNVCYQLSMRSDWLHHSSSFLRSYGPKRSRVKKKKRKQEGGQYPSILNEQAWSIKDLL